MSEIKDSFGKVAAALRDHGRGDVADSLDVAWSRIEETVTEAAAVQTAYEAAERAGGEYFGSYRTLSTGHQRWLRLFRSAVVKAEAEANRTEWDQLGDVPTNVTVTDRDGDIYRHNGANWVRNGVRTITFTWDADAYAPFKLAA